MILLDSKAAVIGWLRDEMGVSRETLSQLEQFAALVADENTRQNLVGASTLGDVFWVRHIADSAQLLGLARHHDGDWVDLGSGAGLPGVIVALLDPQRRVTLIESRRLRCAFLRTAIAQLGLTARVEVIESRVELVKRRRFAAISARAFAPLPKLLTCAAHLSDLSTIWLLPKGQNAVNALSTLPPAWQKLFHVEPSLTDGKAQILVGSGISIDREFA